MSANRLAIIWGGQTVGRIESPVVDNFHLYGRWIPAGPEADIFLAELRRAEKDEDDLELHVGEMPATASAQPDNYGVLGVVVRPPRAAGG